MTQTQPWTARRFSIFVIAGCLFLASLVLAYPPPLHYYEYDIDICVLALNKSPAHDAYVVEATEGQSSQVTEWLHCGPIRAKPSGKEAMSYYGPPLPVDKGTASDGKAVVKYGKEAAKQVPEHGYKGELSYRVLSEGFPIRAELEYRWQDLATKKDEIVIKSEAVFKQEGALTIARSNDYLLLGKLVKRK